MFFVERNRVALNPAFEDHRTKNWLRPSSSGPESNPNRRLREREKMKRETRSVCQDRESEEAAEKE